MIGTVTLFELELASIRTRPASAKCPPMKRRAYVYRDLGA